MISLFAIPILKEKHTVKLLKMHPYKKPLLKSKRLLSLKYIASPWSRQWALDDYKRRLYKAWEEHFFGTMPKEVYEVWMRGMAQFVSADYYTLKAKAVEMWPAWFAWEVKYNSIPKEVHDSYSAEIKHEMFSAFDNYSDSDVGHGGIMQAIADAPVREYSVKPFTKADFDNLVDRFNQSQDAHFAQMEADKAEEKANKIRWDKYYKPFNLPYRP